jgi:hypothetical protein
MWAVEATLYKLSLLFVFGGDKLKIELKGLHNFMITPNRRFSLCYPKILILSVD